VPANVLANERWSAAGLSDFTRIGNPAARSRLRTGDDQCGANRRPGAGVGARYIRAPATVSVYATSEYAECGPLLRLGSGDQRATLSLSEGAARADYPGIETRQVKTTVKACVFDLHAAVHYDGEVGLLDGSGDLLVPRAELEP
jgi:hypothetical protein